METHYHHHHIAPPPVDRPEGRVPSDLEEYLFDLQGFLVIRGALSRAEVEAGNACVDRIPRSVPRDGWFGPIHREDHPEHRGISYQQIYEAGAGSPFERMIDHPNYINYAMRFAGGHETFDRYPGPAFIDENFFNIRGPGDAIPLHAGGHDRCKRMGFGYHNGRFQCGQINVLFAFNDIGPGDGATMVIPGSHKSNIVHPAFKQPSDKNQWAEGGSVDNIAGAVEVHLQAGDAIVFVDACCHGSAQRVNPGERRIAVYRYGSAWNRTRWGYEPSAELLQRLNPFAASIISTGRRRLPAG